MEKNETSRATADAYCVRYVDALKGETFAYTHSKICKAGEQKARLGLRTWCTVMVLVCWLLRYSGSVLLAVGVAVPRR